MVRCHVQYPVHVGQILSSGMYDPSLAFDVHLVWRRVQLLPNVVSFLARLPSQMALLQLLHPPHRPVQQWWRLRLGRYHTCGTQGRVCRLSRHCADTCILGNPTLLRDPFWDVVQDLQWMAEFKVEMHTRHKLDQPDHNLLPSHRVVLLG